jgi:hypothetical protein
MKKITIMPLFFAPQLVFALQALDENELSNVTGEGLGATFENVVLYSEDLGSPNDFELNLFLDDQGFGGNYLRFSELRLNKSGAEPGQADSGGQFGTYLDPFFLGLLVDVNESYSSLHDHDGDAATAFINTPRSHTALYTGFPAANEVQKERSFFYYSRSDLGGLDDETRYRGNPNGFFSSANNVNVGNFFTLANNFDNYLAEQEAVLDQATDKFDLHLRIDSINDSNRNQDASDQFLASIDLEGFRLYGTETFIWSHSRKGQEDARINRAGEIIMADYGLAIATSVGLRADKLTINADPQGLATSALSAEGVDVYLPLGTIDQPMTISTVQFQQQYRGEWLTDGNGNRVASSLAPASTQLRLEIAPLPQQAVQSERGHIYIQQLSFGNTVDADGNRIVDDEVVTGYEDIYLRNSNGEIVETVDDVQHVAFVPKTVTYNEQVKIYNEANPTTPIPYIPNENTLEIKGLEIQRLVITTQDLDLTR